MKELKNNIKFLWTYAKGSKHLLIINIIINILNIAIGIILPILSAKMVVSLSSNELNRLLIIAIILFFVNAFDSITRYISFKISFKLSNNIYKNLYQKLINIIHSYTNKTLDGISTGVFLDRLDTDLNTISKFYWDLLKKLSNLVGTIGTLIAMFIINPLVFAFSVLTILIVFLIDNYNIYKTKKLKKEKKIIQEKSTGLLTETVRGLRDIKMLNVERNSIKRIDNQINEVNQIDFKIQKTSNIYNKLGDTASDLGKFLNVLFYVFLISKKSLTVTNALVLFNYYSDITFFTGFIGDIMNLINDFNISTGRIKELFDNEKFDVETFGTKHIKKVKGKFEFKDVHFGYKDNEVLKGVSFTVNPDETVSFVGKTGSGKTTIFNLLCKMYEVNSGEILIDNVNINELDKDTIRGNITVISQSPYIFNMSIKDNLKLVKPNITNKEMKEALKTACLYDYVESLPDKYDTILGEGGVTLSGGQKQRLAIARALIQKTEIILFDEATSALDNETQEKITKAINNMKREYTIMIIAHRLSTIINADKIFFLNNGVIECSGSHEYLLKHSKDYKKLYEKEIKEMASAKLK